MANAVSGYLIHLPQCDDVAHYGQRARSLLCAFQVDLPLQSLHSPAHCDCS